MDARGFLDELAGEEGVGDRLVHVEPVPARDPDAEPVPDLPSPIPERLQLLGIEGLYPHQREGLRHLSEGRNVVVATGTASGKTLVYDLAFAKAAVEDPRSTALFVFPTKALARDQLRQIRDLRLSQIRAAVYDGDTPGPERPLIRRTANLVLTNPDMLHAGILPGHAQWADFFLRLSLVVLDEAHTARGVFGSHVAMVLRRLRRLVAHYGGDPRFVLASATIGNPGELAERLTGLPFEEVTEDRSPRGEKLFCLWNPPMIDEDLGTRRSTIGEAAFLLSRLVEHDTRAIAFARSRRAAEILAEAARSDLPSGVGGRIKAYRAGYLPEERRELERKLASGELLAVASTTALELGIDIGSLDAAVLAGYPGTRASMWQQAGRAGRRSEASLAFLVAQDDPLDQYLVTHPEDLFSKPPEAAVIDPTNPYVLRPHLACAAREHPMAPEEAAFFGDAASDAMSELMEEGVLVDRRGRIHHRPGPAPHRSIDIRSASGTLFLIVEAETGALLGTVDESRAFFQVHPGAIYLHQGEQYEVLELDLERHVALVKESNADYYTQSRDTTDIEVLGVLAESKVGETPMFFGDVRVTTQVVGYQRKMHRSGDVLDNVPLDLPAQRLDTRSVWWAVPDATIERAEVSPAALPGSAHAAEHAAIGLLPLVATCDRWDVGGVSTAFHEDTGSCAIFIYDGYQGGAGISERGFASGERLLRATMEAILSCPCQSGCPSCVQSPKCGNGNDPLDKAGGAALLREMLMLGGDGKDQR
ncbi:MAG TPA: DEAD/DEAH box helicase [Actinomycetota bacterium]|nr:DEAD/DEAH box helicase [Actinomycetota bacterium]